MSISTLKKRNDRHLRTELFSVLRQNKGVLTEAQFEDGCSKIQYYYCQNTEQVREFIKLCALHNQQTP